MKKILNLMMIFVSIFVGNILFPQYIVVDGWKTSAIATVVIFIIQSVTSIVIALIMSVLLGVIASGRDDSLSVIAAILYFILWLAVLFVTTVSFVVADKLIDDFTIINTLTYFVLGFMSSVFPVSLKRDA